MKRLALLIAVALAVLFGLFFLFARPMTAQGQMKSVLHNAGFAKISIASSAKMPGGYNYDSISLDPNQFSTIESASLLSGKDGHRDLTLNKLVLTGDWRNNILPEISGWAAPRNISALADSLRKNKIDSLTLNGGQLDVVVPVAGLIRLEAKGRLNLLPDGAVRLQAVLWSVQKQLKAEIHVNGEFARNGIASLDFEVVDGRVALDALEASRLGGWLILNKNAGTAPWSVSAQLVAGAAKFKNLALNGLTMSVQGSLQEANVTLQAGGTDNNGTALAVDAQLRAKGKDKINATLRADNSASLLQIFSAAETGQLPTDTRPGAIVYYESEAETISGLRDSAIIGIGDLAGQLWLNGRLRKTETGMDLDIQQVALQNLGRVFGLDSFTANGVLTGLIPLLRDENGMLRLDQGLLRATQPAHLSYKAGRIPPALTTQRKDALALLESFSYDNLEILIGGPLSGQLEGDISMTGKPGGDAKATLLNFRVKGSLLDD